MPRDWRPFHTGDLILRNGVDLPGPIFQVERMGCRRVIVLGGVVRGPHAGKRWS